MAYITAEEITSRLPGGGYGLREGEAQGFIEDWIAMLAPNAPAGSPEIPETPLSRAIVARGAFSAALETAMVRDGYVEVPVAERLHKEAKEMLARFDASTVTPGEGPVVKASGVSNNVPELWSEQELDRRLGGLHREEFINQYPGSDSLDAWDL